MVEDSDKEKSRRRRSGRRCKQNSGNGFVFVDGINEEEGESGGGSGSLHFVEEVNRKEPLRASPVDCCSQSKMGIFESPEQMEVGISKILLMRGSSPVGGSSNCTRPESNGWYNGLSEGKYFAPYWTERVVNEALEKGHAFKAVFRVNAYNRFEAYCTVDGVPVDVLVSGAAAQNRAVEGDIVAVVFDPVACWTRFKGSSDHSNNLAISGDSVICLEDSEGADNAITEKKDFDSKNHAYPKNPQLTMDDQKYASQQSMGAMIIQKVCTLLNSYPSKRPTGRVVGIIEKSHRRDRIIGFLSLQPGFSDIEMHDNQACGRVSRKNKTQNLPAMAHVTLIPTDSKFPNMIIPSTSFPINIKRRLDSGDSTLGTELIAAQIDNWSEDSLLPQACVVQTLGSGREIEAHVSAILYENAIYKSDFPFEALDCLPDLPWKIPLEEIERRKDLKHLCTFTIDPSTATDLDDALSIEKICDDTYRVGVHIADVSYFIRPETPIDIEAQSRSTSVYILQHKLPMLPSLVSEDLSSLLPGVDRLAFSIIWDISSDGGIIDQWIGHSVIHSCCKLSYECAQGIIDGSSDYDCLRASETAIHGQFTWNDIFWSVSTLHEISRKLKENRLKDGALSLENAKLGFLFDECGTPYDGFLYEREDSNFLVEEFMLLANKTIAEVISRSFPDHALLRRHPKPNLRKLKEFRAFCLKRGFELDVSSSRHLQTSLSKLKGMLKDDPVLFDTLVSYASKPMQLAVYFCTGDLKDKQDEWAHYSLAVPLYTHFTSPLRRYPDIIVHRTLSAVLEAEEMHLQHKRLLCEDNCQVKFVRRCFSGINFDRSVFEFKEGREALSSAAWKHKVPSTAALSKIALYCNERKLASKRAEEAGDKLYLWALLQKKEIFSEARVMGLGPRFMSVYVHKIGMERKIYYAEVEGLAVDWLETTSTLVLDLSRNKRSHRSYPGRFYPLNNVALVMNPCDLALSEENRASDQGDDHTAGVDPQCTSESGRPDPVVFPLTLSLLSAVPVVLHAVGGDDGPPDIAARLYMCSYFE